MSHNITVEGGSSVRLPTKGKYCDRDIVITAEGGSEDLDAVLTEQEELITELQDALRGKAAGSGAVLPELTNPASAWDIVVGKQAIDGEGNVIEGVVNVVDGDISSGDCALFQSENGIWMECGMEEDVLIRAGLNFALYRPASDFGDAAPEDVTAGKTFTSAAGLAVVGTATASGDGSDPNALLDAALSNTLTDIDSNVTSIVAYACRGLSKLKTVNLPNATSIGTYAFYYCTALSSFSAPKVTTLNTYVFYNCDKISSINFPLATSVPTQCFYSCGILKKADFGAAKSIAASAFPYCEQLVTLILRRSDAICTLANKNAFTDTPIEDGTGYVYVPAALKEQYAQSANWSAYANQFRAIEDYPEICGGET